MLLVTLHQVHSVSANTECLGGSSRHPGRGQDLTPTDPPVAPSTFRSRVRASFRDLGVQGAAFFNWVMDIDDLLVQPDFPYVSYRWLGETGDTREICTSASYADVINRSAENSVAISLHSKDADSKLSSLSELADAIQTEEGVISVHMGEDYVRSFGIEHAFLRGVTLSSECRSGSGSIEEDLRISFACAIKSRLGDRVAIPSRWDLQRDTDKGGSSSEAL